MRLGLGSIVLLAVLAGACAGGEDSGPSPTAPTPQPAPVVSSTPTPPSNSCLPGAATNLAVTLSGSTRTLTWAAGANATGYDIQIGSESGASDFVRANTTQTTYAWTGGGRGTFYTRVHSHNSCGSGPPSAELIFN